ncbi:MAG: TAXI family TRAP transporter solute-binding subunit [Desulfobacterium sp.]|nr:TAXI family TRAP transporter solute-binding subunit [Desulfobacterium sp.]
MKKVVAIASFVLISLLLLADFSLAVDLGMMTGGRKGTYYQFGLNMMELAKQHGFDLHVHNSTGSVENVYAVYKRPKTQMGIVQSDVLAFVLKVKSDATLKRIARKTKMVFPLYDEEVHLVARPGINAFDDLEGKRVAIGKEGSGSFLTSKLLIEVSGVNPKTTVTVGTLEALSMLKKGEIDAMFYVAGVPVKLFSENIAKQDNLHLVTITNKSILEFYPDAVIPTGTYAWQNNDVKTIAVKAVLTSFDFRRNNCDHVGKFAGVVYNNLGWLRQNGHPKWKSVNLDYPLKGWSQYGCVKKYINPSDTGSQVKGDVNPLLEAIKEML